nr:hypothetical protein MFMH1_06280 [Myxococcus sp. MH1]
MGGVLGGRGTRGGAGHGAGDCGRGAARSPPLFVLHVTIESSQGPGIVLNGTAGFAEGSSDLTIRGAGNEARPHPMMVNPNALETLPAGTYTGNVEDTVYVGPSIASSSVYYPGRTRR